MTTATATIIATTPFSVTVEVAGEHTAVTWSAMIAAAQQADVETATAYRSMLERAVAAEVERVRVLPLRLDAGIDTIAAGAAYEVRLLLRAGEYSLPAPHPRRRDEGGQLPSGSLAQLELDERLARLPADFLGGHKPTVSDVRRAVLMFHGLASVYASDDAIHLRGPAS